MEDEYVDVRGEAEKYRRARDLFEVDEKYSARNRELVLRFLRDAGLGKTNPGSGKKRVGQARLQSYINYLCILARFVEKDLDQVTEPDMERFVEALDSDAIRSRRPVVHGRGKWHRCGRPLSSSYKARVKQGVKKFYKWLLGDNIVYPKLVDWIEVLDEWAEVPALTKDEVELMVDLSSTVEERVVIQVLFDGGFRVSELLNIRFKHLCLKGYDESDPRKKCFVVRVPFSKTLRRTVSLPMHASHKWLTRWLEQHPAKPGIREDGTIEAEDPGALLFPMTYKSVSGLLRRSGLKALKKRVYAHLMRHTSATYWCNRLPHFKLCKRFGWTMTSRMPQRYIDREGIDDLEVARIYAKEIGAP